MRKELLRILGVAALVGSSACLPTYEAGAPTPQKDPADEQSGPQTANASSEPVAVRPVSAEDQTVSWINAGDAAAIAERANDEGPVEVASRHHACMKVKFETVGRMLNSLGVDLGALPLTDATTLAGTARTITDSLSGGSTTITCANLMSPLPSNTNQYIANLALFQPAKFIYCDARLTLGLAQYDARLAEATTATTASSTKLLDLFVTAASEIINANTAAMAAPAAGTPGARYKAQCQNGAGQVTPLFTTNGSTTTCNLAALTCLQGYPATEDQVALCNRVLTQAVTSTGVTALDNGKRIAVATVLSAAHSCE